MKKDTLIESLPSIFPLNISSIKEPILFLCAIGFEDRAYTILEEIIRIKKPIQAIIGISYKPVDPKNKTDRFQKLISCLGPEIKTGMIVYDRYNPEGFDLFNKQVQGVFLNVSSIVVDISGMSKFLIILLLNFLKKVKSNVYVVYTEAEKYYPLKDDFIRSKENGPENVPEFLTTSIYNIVTTQSVSSASMQGYPLLMIAFPTFNQKELFALINELSPKSLVLIEGTPHEEHNIWRKDAIRWINQRMDEYIIKRYTVSTFKYKETILTLEKIYDECKYTNKIVVAPTGSKLQTFGVFLFKLMHPDIQLVYPVTRQFAQEYTEGSIASWQISIPDLPGLIRELGEHRIKGLSELKNMIEAKS